MKNFFLLLLLVGLGYAGWHFKDKLPGINPKSTTLDEEGAEGASDRPPDPDGAPRPNDAPRPAGTPHPALEAQTAVMKAYPALGLPDSPFNRQFKEFHAEAKRNSPELMSRPDWPIKIAERTAIALGGGVQPVAMPTPAATLRPMTPPRSSLDKLPPSAHPKQTPGSSLDRKPPSAKSAQPPSGL